MSRYERTKLADRLSQGTRDLNDKECDLVVAALRAPEAGDAGPVAYRWKPKGAAVWIYNPEARWLAGQSLDTIDVEPLYAAPTAAGIAAPPESVRHQVAKIATEIRLGTSDGVPDGWHETGLKFADRFLAIYSGNAAPPAASADAVREIAEILRRTFGADNVQAVGCAKRIAALTAPAASIHGPAVAWRWRSIFNEKHWSVSTEKPTFANDQYICDALGVIVEKQPK